MPMNSPTFEPDLSKLYDIEEAELTARLDATRAVLSHGGEKGRALEGEVSKLLRPILPSEYGLSTCFIAYEDEEGCFRLSSQLDIIIYDALRCGALARFESCDVFPLEAVYGYIEVKAAIDTSTIDKPPLDSLEYCIKKSTELRGMRTRDTIVQSVEPRLNQSISRLRTCWQSALGYLPLRQRAASPNQSV